MIEVEIPCEVLRR